MTLWPHRYHLIFSSVLMVSVVAFGLATNTIHIRRRTLRRARVSGGSGDADRGSSTSLSSSSGGTGNTVSELARRLENPDGVDLGAFDDSYRLYQRLIGLNTPRSAAWPHPGASERAAGDRSTAAPAGSYSVSLRHPKRRRKTDDRQVGLVRLCEKREGAFTSKVWLHGHFSATLYGP